MNEKDKLLTESEAGLLKRYIDLRKVWNHTGAVLQLCRERNAGFGDIEEEIRKVFVKVLSAYAAFVAEQSAFPAQTPEEPAGVCQRNGNRCSLCGAFFGEGEDVCGSGHVVNQRYPKYIG